MLAGTRPHAPSRSSATISVLAITPVRLVAMSGDRCNAYAPATHEADPARRRDGRAVRAG